MTCYYPLHGWKSAERTEKGKRAFTLRKSEALLDMPLTVPCGKCAGCRADQALMWSVRCYHESTQHAKNSFVTLTYDDDNLPADGKIDKRDLQLFFKRVRKAGLKFRYFACGEYGEKTRRPHYHAIIFGQDFAFDRVDISESLYTSESLMSLWGAGHVSIAPVELHSIMYVCGYTAKKVGDPDTFSLCSTRPAIGDTWLSSYKDDLVRTGTVTIDGREFVVPKRYLMLYENDFENLRKDRAQIAKAKPFDPEALMSKEVNKQWKVKQKNEKI